MPPLRSRTVTYGRNMAGARALLRATGIAREDIGKPIIAVANSFTERGAAGLRRDGHLGLRSEEHTSELQSQFQLVCRPLLEKKKKNHLQSELTKKQETTNNTIHRLKIH